MSLRPPAHGEYSRYAYHGCRCTDCRKACRAYRLRLAYDHTNGVRRRIDATQTRVHIERLQARSWSQAQIAAAAGIHQATVSVTLSQATTTVRRSTAAAVLAIRLDQDPPIPRGFVDATGTRRRLQALAVLGYPVPEVARRTGVGHSSLQQTADGHWSRIKSTTATKVARLYRQLSTTPAPVSRTAEQARNEAMQRGWCGPMAWADIDDPRCVPEPEEHTAPKHVHAQDVAELAAQGLDDHEIGRRLGVSPRTILRARAAHHIPARAAA